MSDKRKGGGGRTQGPRVVAARILQQVLSGRSLAALFPEYLESVVPSDRALTKELCFGTIRWWFRLDAILAQLLKRPLKPKDGDIRSLMMIGLYQLLYTRISDHVAVAESVEAVRALKKPWAAGVVNGVLRSFQRQRETLLEQADRRPDARFSLPPWLLENLRGAWPEHWQQIARAGVERPPMSLRVNCARISRPDYLEMLREKGIAALPITATPTGLVLEQPMAAPELPGFEAGLISVQDGGAQLAASLLDLEPGMRVLDACAAPGGKSCHIMESAPERTRLVAVDKDPKRLARVSENLSRLDLDAKVMTGDVSRMEGEWASQEYDRILLDVPCSATGVLRRHPDIKLLRRPEDIASLIRTQRGIMDSVWALLKPGGRLVYATCSVLPGENEQQIARFLDVHSDSRELLTGDPGGTG